MDNALRRLLVEPMEADDALALRGAGLAGDLGEIRRFTAPHS